MQTPQAFPRRRFLLGAGGASASLFSAPASALQATKASAGSGAPRHYYLLHWYFMRSGPQVDRTTKFLGGAYLPAAKRAGATSAGFFNSVIAERSPFILALTAYPSLPAIEAADDRMAADADFQAAADAYDIIGEPAYLRMETTLLRAFPAIPELTAPANDGKRATRIFELRTYESSSQKASLRKIKMFEDGEAAIFRRLGMAPVFFGQTLAGADMPSLSYMLSYESLAARENLWKLFGADPEWQKLRARPGLSDAEIVSNISNQMLKALPFSEIR